LEENYETERKKERNKAKIEEGITGKINKKIKINKTKN
jgi:hypothetical protein